MAFRFPGRCATAQLTSPDGSIVSVALASDAVVLQEGIVPLTTFQSGDEVSAQGTWRGAVFIASRFEAVYRIFETRVTSGSVLIGAIVWGTYGCARACGAGVLIALAYRLNDTDRALEVVLRSNPVAQKVASAQLLALGAVVVVVVGL